MVGASSEGRVPTGWAKEVILDDAAFRNNQRLYEQGLKSQELARAGGGDVVKKRKRENKGDSSILHGKGAYKGPWARFQSTADVRVSGRGGRSADGGQDYDTEEVEVEEGVEGEQYGSDVEVVYVYEDETGGNTTGSESESGDPRTRKPSSKISKLATDYDAVVESPETTEFHGESLYDYQGRTYMHVPTDVNINLRGDISNLENFIPKKVIHTWKQHAPSSITQLRFFPNSGHLLLSASSDSTVKIYDVYHKRDLLRTYKGHSRSVNDVCFNNDGSKFLTSSYDRQMKLWDTETGACVGKFSTGKTAHVIRFNPDPGLNHEFIAGMSDKKIVQFDTRAGTQVQEYDHHLGPVNTLTFCDENRRFISTSDDKSLRAWEYGIPVPIKFIAEPHMFSMVRSAPHPNNKFVAFQSLDDQIVVYASTDKFRQNRKKQFEGHHNAGYAVDLSFSPDGSYLTSGDADGKVYVWDWKSCKLKQTLPVSDSAVLAVQWHPRETSKLATGDLNGVIKYWD